MNHTVTARQFFFIIIVILGKKNKGTKTGPPSGWRKGKIKKAFAAVQAAKAFNLVNYDRSVSLIITICSVIF
jgi:hypothetical protein